MCALLRINQGKTNEACEDLLSCHRLARLVEQSVLINDYFVRWRIDTGTFNHIQVLLNHSTLNSIQATKMYHDFTAFPPKKILADCLGTYMRFQKLDQMVTFARLGTNDLKKYLETSNYDSILKEAVKTVLDNMEQIPIDWNIVLSTINVCYDRAIGELNNDTRADQLAAIDKFNIAMTHRVLALKKKADGPHGYSPKEFSEQIGLIFCSIDYLSPGYGSETSKWRGYGHRAIEVGADSSSIICVSREHDDYPDQLVDLTPNYIEAIPKDIFSDEKPHYRRDGKGYLLYSVGINGQDDNGNPVDDRRNTTDTVDGDDLTIRIKR